MVQDDTVGLVAADEGSMKRSNGDKGMVGAHGSKSTPMKGSKCNAAAHDKVVKMDNAGPLRHHRVRNHRYLDYLVGSVSYYPYAKAIPSHWILFFIFIFYF